MLPGSTEGALPGTSVLKSLKSGVCCDCILRLDIYYMYDSNRLGHWNYFQIPD